MSSVSQKVQEMDNDVQSNRKLSSRGEKARNKLKLAGAIVLERLGYRDMKVGDVTKEAGVAAGLFYHYFPDLQTLTLEVLSDFIKRFEALEDIERDVPKGDWFSRIIAHYTVAVNAYADHPGTMRCLFQFSDEVASFDTERRQSMLRLVQLLVNPMRRMFPQAGLDDQEALLIAHALSGVGSNLLYEYYIIEDPTLTACKLSKAEMTELISVLFYRGMFLESPPVEALRFSSKLKKMRRALLATSNTVNADQPNE